MVRVGTARSKIVAEAEEAEVEEVRRAEMMQEWHRFFPHKNNGAESAVPNAQKFGVQLRTDKNCVKFVRERIPSLSTSISTTSFLY